jgi:anti-sigma factor RsiW
MTMSERHGSVTCEETREFLLSRIADESMPEPFRVHLEACVACRREVASIAQLDRRLRDQLNQLAAPPELWVQIALEISRIEKDTPAALRPSLLTRWRGGLLRGAGAVLTASILAYGAWMWTAPPRESDLPVVVEPINDAITFRVSGRPLDFTSGSSAQVASWFADKTDFPLPAVPSQLAGFELKGSRLCYFLHRRLAAVSYEGAARTFTLYIMSGAQLDLPAANAMLADQVPLSRQTVKNYTNLVWRDGATVYALVSDLPDNLLVEIAAQLRLKIRTTTGVLPAAAGRIAEPSARQPNPPPAAWRVAQPRTGSTMPWNAQS